MRHISLFAVLLAAFTFTGCATPKLRASYASAADVSAEREKQAEIALSIRQQRWKRLNAAAKRIGDSADDLCSHLTGKSLGCGFRMRMVDSDELNASFDGKEIAINSGMVRFTENDDELAFILGHEVAHKMMDHLGSHKVNAFVGGFFGLVLDVGAAAAGVNTGGLFMQTLSGQGAKAYSQEFESEADMVGLYLASRAGFDVDKAPMLWRRMAAEHPASIEGSFTALHPSTPERFVAMENVIRKIHDRQTLGLPLVPDKKE